MNKLIAIIIAGALMFSAVPVQAKSIQAQIDELFALVYELQEKVQSLEAEEAKEEPAEEKSVKEEPKEKSKEKEIKRGPVRYGYFNLNPVFIASP